MIASFAPPSRGEPAELIFEPKPGIDYVLGVSSYSPAGSGTYVVTVVNEGLPMATALGSGGPPAPTAALFRKLPRSRKVIRIPRPEED